MTEDLCDVCGEPALHKSTSLELHLCGNPVCAQITTDEINFLIQLQAEQDKAKEN